ncbi:MAG TPA: hypothetical protein VFV50_19050 [Bdellovibrionales bacterium]|nr:hypothetical protein [Bdellovibrionales bacterium]
MKRAAAILCLFLSVPVGAAEYRRADNLDLRGQFEEILFAAGGEVSADIESTDDVFVAGGRLGITARTSESLYLGGGTLNVKNTQARTSNIAGGEVKLSDSKFRELLAAGGTVELDRVQLEDDLILAGGRVMTGSDSKVGGSALVAGGDVTLDGTFSRDTRVAGGQVVLAAEFGGPVHVYAEKLVVKSDAVIRGDLIYTAETADISPEAKITGERRAVPREKRESDWAGAAAAFSVWGVFFGLGLLLIPALVASAIPGIVAASATLISGRFWESLGKGVLLVIVFPMVFAILAMTAIGLPAALAFLPFLIAGKVIAVTSVAYVVGQLLRGQLGRGAGPQRKRSVFGWTLLGTIVVMIALWIPFVGVLVFLVSFFTSLGAVFAVASGHVFRRRSA